METYGLPRGSAINYGKPGFPPWVYELCRRFGLQASTYPGHQESERPDLKCAPNPQHQNRGIDWAGPPDKMLTFARWLRDTHPPGVEMVIYQDPRTGEQVGYPTWVNYSSDYSGHRDHVHTRNSANPIEGEAYSKDESIPQDTLFADVSEWQKPVDDSYPYRVLSIRSNDGSHLDKNWATNYAWCRKAADAGKLDCFIVYYYWRPGVDSVSILQRLVGTPHPKMAVMIDVERGGNPTGNFSSTLNDDDQRLAQWLGDERRVIAYGNTGDLNALWPDRRETQFVIAGYGSNPSFPGKIAHQYTDGNGYGGGLPEGCPPFGNCDMNSADGYTPKAFATALGIAATPTPIPTQEDDMAQVPQSQWDALFHALMDPVPSQSALRMPGEGKVGSPIQLIRNIDGMLHPMLVELLARLGDPRELARLHAVADTVEAGREGDAALAATILDRIASGDPVLVTNPAVQVTPTPAAMEATVRPPDLPRARIAPSTTGQLIGKAYDALAELQLSAGLPAEAQAPMDALISVLKTYPKETS